jgi:8-oxo-dGTP pyrophosphatase MutT (NUDIX family)
MFTLRRPAARVVLLDPQKRVFLINAEDPMDPYKPAWWEIPGGGMGHGEGSGQAAGRELYEETGFTKFEMGPCIWTQQVEFDFGGYHFDSDERIHVANTTEIEPYEPAALEALEAAAFMTADWWCLDDLLASDAPVLPERLREFLPAIVAGELPDEPINISPQQRDGSGPT